MRKRLKQKFAELFAQVTPNYLFAFLIRIYWNLHPHREKIVFFQTDGSWLAVREDDSKFFMQNVKAVWVIPYCEVYEQLLKVEKGDIVLDVGASIGGFTIPAAKKVGEEGFVVAIEPCPVNLAYLRKSVKINRLQNVQFVEKAAFNCRKRLSLHLSNSYNIDTHSLIYEEGKDSIEVSTDTLDNIVYELGLTGVDFIKMDIEGAEIEALQGAERVLSKAKKVVVAAYHIRNGKKTSSYVRRFLKTRGFKVCVCSEDLVNAWKNNIK